MRSTSLALLSLLFVLTGCSDSGNPQGTADDPISFVEDDDPEMAAAEKQAAESIDEFIATLRSPSSSQSSFGVKTDFLQGDLHEHMWVTKITYKDGVFHGVLANDPQIVKNIRIGEEVSVARAQVEDWMYYEGDDFIGGFTSKLLMKREGM